MADGRVKLLLHPFFERLRASGGGVLALDYDGTLAPFRIDPMQAVPYPGVREAIARILATGKTRVVLISGRRAEEVRELLAFVRRRKSGACMGGRGCGPTGVAPSSH